MADEQPQKVVIIGHTKNVYISVILTILFGPLGMLYSTVSGAIIMIVVSVLAGMLTGGISAFITWPICVIWTIIATESYNEDLRISKRQ